jgi:hypothetical protein
MLDAGRFLIRHHWKRPLLDVRCNLHRVIRSIASLDLIRSSIQGEFVRQLRKALYNFLRSLITSSEAQQSSLRAGAASKYLLSIKPAVVPQ